MSQEEPSNDIDTRLGELFEGIAEFRSKCFVQSAMRLTSEARRLAKAERRLIAYLHANFYVMNLSQDLFDDEAVRDAAIENIAMLESPEHARAFQSDYDEAGYEQTVQWMSACSYDNLATATGVLQGYNNPGMQACIADGIAVCRRTGKMECITCFREYAINVHRSGDDLAMAMHHAQTNLTARPSANSDRRCMGAHDIADLLLLSGEFEPAFAAASQALALTDTYHTPLRARRMARVLMRRAGHLAGKPEWVEAGTDPAADKTPRGEDAVQDLRDNLVEAVAEAMRGNHAAAIDRLTPLDAMLSNHKAWHWWFEVRLHLVALNRLAGKSDRAAALAKPLEKRAKETDDFLTLRRLARTLSPDETPLPFPIAGPMASKDKLVSLTPTQPAAAGANAAPTDEPGPLRPVLDELTKSVGETMFAAAQAGEPPKLAQIVEQFLAISPADATHPDDAARLLHMLTYLLQDTSAHERIWTWASAIADRHPTSGIIMAILAQLAAMLRSDEGSPLADSITPADIEAMFRKAMELDPQSPGAFRRAGTFFAQEGNDAEAERCLARAFRLDRSDERIASQLAEVYAMTERPADALAVLDMCLREGNESADLLWQAGTRAMGLGRHESTLTYLDRLEQVDPSRPWVQYYRALALLPLNRPAEALAAIDVEAERSGQSDSLHLNATRAAAASQLENADDVRRHLAAALAVPLGSIEDLTLAGISSCHDRLWQAAVTLPPDDATRTAVADRLLASGLTPEEFWEHYRDQFGENAEGLSHYVVDLRQPLDETWGQSPACPPGCAEWPSYVIRYGVLAKSEDDALAAVLAWQVRCASAKPKMLNISSDNGAYTDQPGVTSRSNLIEDEAQ